VPPEKVHEVVPCIPKQCDECAGLLHGQDPEPHRHQVFELPPVEPIVTEYQQHALDCRLCNHRTMGKLPEGVSARAFGPTVDAVVAVLMGVYRLTKRQVPELMRDLFGLQMSVGAVIGCQEAASAAIAQTVEDARSYAKQQPVKHADETGWREGAGRSRAWLWTVVTTHVVVFMIHARRNAEAAKELLGDWLGVLVTDRHGAYHWWPNCRRQFCWAHLKRDIQAIVEREGESGRIGKGMLDEVERMFTWWHRVRDGTLARSSFRVYMRTVQKRCSRKGRRRPTPKRARHVRCCSSAATPSGPSSTSKDVEPTNNGAEQAIRHGVIMRKISYGTHSTAGSRFVERMLTIHATLRRQHRNILDFMRASCLAARRNHRGPSILPIEASVSPLRRAA
jgi:transposase